MNYDFDWTVLFEERNLTLLMDGLATTLILAAWSLTFAILIGIPVGVARLRKHGVIAKLAYWYVNFLRSTPPLVHILLWFFGASYILPRPVFQWLVDLDLKFWTTIIALSIYTSAFIAEIVRAGIQGIPKGQFEAGSAIGLSRLQVARFVVFPPVTRITMPPLISEFVGLLKNTALGIGVGLTELTFAARYIQDQQFRVIEAYTAATVLYLAIGFALVLIANVLTRKLQTER